MKIISPRNIKDYYDYIVGIYGIDEKIVYDRRKYTILSAYDSPLFNKTRIESDRPLYESWEWVDNKKITVMKGHETHCLLEIGMKWYLFIVSRYIDDDNMVHIDWKLDQKVEATKHLGTAPMSFITSYCVSHYYRRGFRGPLKINCKEENVIKNPILRDTTITSLITPQEIYNELYSYISSLRDSTIIDTRTDTQKAESHGFDRKTSFRNVK